MIEPIFKALGWLYGVPRRIDEAIERLRKQRHCTLAEGATLHPQSRLTNRRGRKAIRIGRGSHVLCRFETYAHGGEIRVGEYTFIGEDTYIWSMSSVTIGDRVLISHAVNIHDTNSHSLSAAERQRHFSAILGNGADYDWRDIKSAPVTIEDDAWIGFGAAVLKGVTVGRGAVVAAGAVVTKDVAAYTIVAGNPARVIGAARP